MILTARNYLKNVLETIGISKILDQKAEMKPILWATVESPNPEEYTESYTREVFTDENGIRTYHVKDYDVSLVMLVCIGSAKAETTLSYKNAFLKGLKRYIESPDGYRIDVVPLNSELDPAEYLLPNISQAFIRIRFVGGLWRQETAKLIQGVVPEGEFIKNKI